MRDSSQRSARQLKDGNASRGAQPCAPTKTRFFLFNLYLIIFFLFVLAGCVPAKVPPQLAATPGAAVVITEQEYDAGAFKVRYPAGWRVITSAATSPTTVIFAAPDNAAIMLFGVDATEAPMLENDAQIRTETRQITLENGLHVTAILNAPADAWDVFVALFDQAVESVK
jgi:hypothetical protein